MKVSQPWKLASGAATFLLVTGAVTIGGGHPISPARIAVSTSAAVRNAHEAQENTSRAATSTRALATIARNVDSQVRSSRRLLEIQLQLERSSRRGAERSVDLQRGIEGVRRRLASLGQDISVLTALSRRTVTSGRASTNAANNIQDALEALERRFREVVRESKRLNEKARGFAELRDGPG
jgi:DNA repair exonuclease SbcCD ATPase subunit